MSRKPYKRRVRPHSDDPGWSLDEGGVLVLVALAILALFAVRASLAQAAAPRPAAPALTAPASGATAQALPSFSWRRAARATRYEFELSADAGFESLAADFQTGNTYATVDKAPQNGTYYWRVRGIDARNRTGRWSSARSIAKQWTVQPQPQAPAEGAAVAYPGTPLVLRWTAVPGAYKYVVNIATDPSMAHSVIGTNGQGVETSGTVFAPVTPLTPGRYYWTATPLDSERHPGARSAVASFIRTWPTATQTAVDDLFVTGDPQNSVFDPRFSWDPVPGAASYQVEVNPSVDWAVGSKVCCDDAITGTSISPLALLPNNAYYWRVRAVDSDGNAGQWNVGATFTKSFDDNAPTITGLRVSDNVGDATPATGPSGIPTTDAPVIRWNPVPGASSYDVQVAPWQGFCNWSQSLGSQFSSFLTATPAWTPLGPVTGVRPVGNAYPTVNYDLKFLVDGTDYCVRVRARTDRDAKNAEIVSDWTQLGGLGNRAFSYSAHVHGTCTGASTRVATPASAYRTPQTGSISPRMPVFTWDWVPGACGYFVVVARDPAFTKIVDVALTDVPAYAPRFVFPISYTDETTSYYWAVLPTKYSNGDGLSTQPQEDSPQAFQKRSVPPALLSPAEGQVVGGQPTFRWSGVEAALDYRIQVDDDPTFGNPIDDVKTHSTGYTSSKTYPADTVLYWRVRADAENGAAAGSSVGLDWSATGTFRRRLEIPSPSASNPSGGETIPALTWTPVTGAISYDMHVEQADGTKRDFTLRSTAFTPIAFYGTGVWRWQVRANFRSGFATVPGGYSPLVPFTRRIDTPSGLSTARAGGGALLSWQPAAMAKQYKVQISDSDSFTTVIDQALVDGTSFAPHMTQLQYAKHVPLYWRVAVVDEGLNTGGWASAPMRAFRTLPGMRARVRGRLHHGRTARVRVRVTTRNGFVLKGATVKATARRMTSRHARTGRLGTATLRLHPRAKGRVTIRVSRRGYASAIVRMRVR